MEKPPLTTEALAEDLPEWGVLVLESHHSINFAMEWRTHDFLKLIFVLRGNGVIEIDNRVVHFSEGDVVAVPAGLRNRITDAPDAASSLYICCISTTLFQFDSSLMPKVPLGKVPGGPHLSNRVASQLRRMRHDQSNQPDHVALSMVSAALRLVEWVVTMRDRRAANWNTEQIATSGGHLAIAFDEREIMKDYIARLRTEFYDVTTIDDAAASLRMSRRTFTKLFRESTGETWLQHVRKLAINHAKHSLAQTDLSIASIAFESGFGDLSTFYRQFKSQVGVSPQIYRKSVGV